MNGFHEEKRKYRNTFYYYPCAVLSTPCRFVSVWYAAADYKTTSNEHNKKNKKYSYSK